MSELRSLIDPHIKSCRTVRSSDKLTGVNRPPARCEDVIFVTSTFHMSMESSFETQFKVVLLKTDPEHHFPDPHSFKLSNRTDNLNRTEAVTDTTQNFHVRRSYFHSRSSKWNVMTLLRKFHSLPKLIFLNIKVVVSHTHEFHPKIKMCNRQLNRYMKLIFSESP